MIQNHWKRVCGVSIQEDGNLSAVWIAHDKDTDCVHLYDACSFKNEVAAVIAESINARGRYIPVGFEQSDEVFSKQLYERGCNVLPDLYKDVQAASEAVSRDIWERMRGSRFKVDKRLKNWVDEFNTFYRRDAQVPTGHPLMAATRVAMANLQWAKSNAAARRGRRQNYPQMAIALIVTGKPYDKRY